VETIAFPNKAFVYLSAGLPIIFSVDGDLRRIAEAAKIGFYFKPGDVAMLIDLIAKLDNDRSLMENMRNNAQRVFEEMFDSNNLYSEFAAYIETVSDVHKKGLY
jgi:glycosyltransferase involved in cell wall biosynthesis